MFIDIIRIFVPHVGVRGGSKKKVVFSIGQGGRSNKVTVFKSRIIFIWPAIVSATTYVCGTYMRMTSMLRITDYRMVAHAGINLGYLSLLISLVIKVS